MEIIISILSFSVAAIVSVIGWFVINHQNRKMRREEVQMKIYNKLFKMTISTSNELTKFNMNTNKKVRELGQIFNKPSAEPGDKTNLINEWRTRVTEILDDIANECVSIDNYLKFLEMGGTNIGSDTPIYQGLKSISIDTNKSLFNITEKWINYINFDDMKENQLNNLVDGTIKDLNCTNEFCDCLDDVLIYLYNSYMAQPLKLQKREINYVQDRRYVTEKGLMDKRPR